MSKPTEDERLRLDLYPPIKSIPEETLIHGYRRARRRIAPEPERRPLGPLYDESGLVYGEPISKGRTDLQRGQE